MSTFNGGGFRPKALGVLPQAQPAYRIEGEPAGPGRFVVESGSVEGVAWIVEVKPGGRLRCRCMAFRTGNACRHALATRAALDAEPVPSLESQLERSVQAERLRRVGEALRG